MADLGTLDPPCAALRGRSEFLDATFILDVTPQGSGEWHIGKHNGVIDMTAVPVAIVNSIANVLRDGK